MVSGGLGSNAGNTRRRALLRFNLAAAIPSGATVTSVQLSLQAVQMLPAAPANSNFELHRLLRAWNEASASWTWADNPSTAWDDGGAGGAGDVATSASASVAVSGLGPYTFSSTPELVADVQLWVDDPGSNAGWLLRSNTEAPFTARHFGTKEGGSSAASLTVEFESGSAPEPATIDGVITANGELSFSFEAQAGVEYGIEFRTGVKAGDWQTVTNLPPLLAPGTVSVTNPIQGSTGFYRIQSASPSP